MFKEILQIIPKLSPNDLNNMERSLGSRFGRLAKKFGKGLAAALTGGGIAGVALGLVDKLLNPLKETQDAIDRVLKQGDDIVTNAQQFGTTAGKLFRLQQLGASTGLDAGSLDVLLTKFQGAVAEARQDPTKQTSVRNFANDTDTAEAFFQFIQALQKMDKTQQVLVQQEVFGEKQILKMADFLQTDFAKQSRVLGGPTAEQLTPGLERLARANDLKDALEARRTLNDTLAKSRIVTQDMVRSQDEQAKIALDRENRQIQSYQDLAKISMTADLILNNAKQMSLDFAGILVKITELVRSVTKISESRALKGLLKWVGGGQ